MPASSLCSVKFEKPLLYIRRLGLPSVQGRTKRRNCCCIFYWQWGTRHSSWRWHLADLPLDLVSWLEQKEKMSDWWRRQTAIQWNDLRTVVSCQYSNVGYTFIYGALLQVRSEKEGRPGVGSIQAADTVRFSAEKRRAAPRVCRVQTGPQ